MGKLLKTSGSRPRAGRPRRTSLLGREVRALLAIGLIGAVAAGAWAVYVTTTLSPAGMGAARELSEATASSSESLLLNGDLSQLRRHVLAVGTLDSVESCSIKLPDGTVLAHSSPASVSLRDAPETWSGAAPMASETVDGATGLVHVTVPLRITGRGEAALELAIHPGGLAAFDPTLLAGEGAIVGLLVVGVLVVLVRVRSKVGAMLSVRGALLDAAAGVRVREALMVDERFGAEAKAWVTLLNEIEELRTSRAEEVVTGVLESGSIAGRGLSEAFDALWQGMLVLNHEGEILYANGAASVLLQARRDALVGSTMASMIQDSDSMDAIRSVLGGTSTGRRVVEIDRSTGEGSEESGGVLRLSFRPLSGGDAGAALVVIEDVTQQRVADRARNAFVANATHELRTPLTNIRLYVEEAVDAEGDEAIRGKALNVINSEARRLERIVGDMLSVSEIEAGSMALNESDVRTDALFEELERDFQASAQEKGIEMKFDLPPKMPVLTGDRDKIAMALHNLVGNAIKYTPAGGEVVVKVEDSDGQFRVEVRDTGIGISEEDSQRVFEKFYRARDKRIKHVTGSGIGLSLAREVVRLHGGDIVVESEIDEGSRFTLNLPAPAQAA